MPQQPTYVHDALHLYAPTYTLRSSDQGFHEVARYKTKTDAHRFSVGFPTIWNTLQSLIHDSSSTSMFKMHLKLHFFCRDFGANWFWVITHPSDFQHNQWITVNDKSDEGDNRDPHTIYNHLVQCVTDNWTISIIVEVCGHHSAPQESRTRWDITYKISPSLNLPFLSKVLERIVNI